MSDLLNYDAEIKKLADTSFENGALAMRLHAMSFLDRIGEPEIALRLFNEVPLPLRGNSP